MEKYLKDLDIWCWAYVGRPRNYHGLHFTAVPNACDALLQCVMALRTAVHGAKRSVPLRSLNPDDERKITGGRKYLAFQTIRIIVYDETQDLRQMCISEIDGVATFEFVRSNLRLLEAGIIDVKNGKGDYCIVPGKSHKKANGLGVKDAASEALWFWPCFSHLPKVVKGVRCYRSFCGLSEPSLETRKEGIGVTSGR